jgi:hypothetical protein
MAANPYIGQMRSPRETRILDRDEALASLRIEGLEPDQLWWRLMDEYIEGAITIDQVLAALLCAYRS